MQCTGRGKQDSDSGADCAASSSASSGSSSAAGFLQHRELRLAADLLNLWPSGKIERPEEYDEAEWEEVMGVNERWSYPAETMAHATAIMSNLTNIQLIIDAAHGLKVLGQHAKMRRGDLDSVCKACRALDQVVGMHMAITKYLMSAVAASGGPRPKNLTVLYNMLEQAHAECGPALRALKKDKVTCRDVEGLVSDTMAFRQCFLSCAREEMEQLIFLVRLYFNEREYGNMVKTVIEMDGRNIGSTPELSQTLLTSLMFGGIPGPDQLQRMSILTGTSTPTLWILQRLILQPTYVLGFSAPLSKIASRAKKLQGHASVRLESIGPVKRVSLRRLSDVSLPDDMFS